MFNPQLNNFDHPIAPNQNQLIICKIDQLSRVVYFSRQIPESEKYSRGVCGALWSSANCLQKRRSMIVEKVRRTYRNVGTNATSSCNRIIVGNRFLEPLSSGSCNLFLLENRHWT